MTYKKLILASGALAATTIAVRVTNIVDRGEELINEFFEVTGVPYVDAVLAPWQIFTPGIPGLNPEDYFSGEKGIIPMHDGMTQIQRDAIAIQNMVMSGYEPYVRVAEFIRDDVGDWFANEFTDFWEDDVGCGFFGIGCKRPPPVAFKNWWKNYATFSSDQIPLDFMDEIDRDTLEHHKSMLASGDMEKILAAYKWITELGYTEFDELTKEKQRQRARFMDEIEAQCQEYQPVGAPSPMFDIGSEILGKFKNKDPKLTDTNGFNENMNRLSSDVLQMLYTLLGKLDGPQINERNCEAVDCLHPCYGENQLGACQKCFQILGKEGKTDQICELCEVPQAPAGYLLPREIRALPKPKPKPREHAQLPPEFGGRS